MHILKFYKDIKRTQNLKTRKLTPPPKKIKDVKKQNLKPTMSMMSMGEDGCRGANFVSCPGATNPSYATDLDKKIKLFSRTNMNANLSHSSSCPYSVCLR